MRIDWSRFTPQMLEEYAKAGLWTETTSNEVLEANARRFPGKIALVDVRGSLTYGEYYAAVQRLATHFLALGLTSGDVIAIQLPNWIEFAIAVNAAMMAGIPFCQFHSDFRSKEVEFILGFTGASAYVHPVAFRGFDYGAMIDELQPRLPQLKHRLAVGDEVPAGTFDLRGFLADPSRPIDDELLRKHRPRGNDLCRVAFTSGTTGDPKAVMHTHNTSLSGCIICNRNQLVDADSATLVFLPVGLNWGFMLTVEAILAGCKAVYMERWDTEEALRLIEREKITHFCSAPTSILAMLDHPNLKKYDLSSLKTYVTGGASAPIEVIRRAQRDIPGRLFEMYGMLETGSQSQTMLYDDPEQVCGTVGHPVPEVPLRILDDEERDVAPGTVGELANVGPSVMVGYYNNPGANERAFTKDGWFKTGDLGFLNENGLLTISGRKKEMIIRGGANIYPREIEEVLFKHPAVADCAVIGLPHPRLGETVVACVVQRAGVEPLTFAAMSAFLREQIATYKLPERLEIVETLPRTPTGKVQKGRLVEVVSAGEPTRV